MEKICISTGNSLKSCVPHVSTIQSVNNFSSNTFYEGSMPMEKRMIEVAGGGALVDKTPPTSKGVNFKHG